METLDLEFVEQKLDKVASISLEWFKVAKQLEVEVATLKALDQQINRKLSRTKPYFEQLRENMNYIV